MIKANRIEFIDLAKGLCILLVVMHHCLNYFIGKEVFAYLRMPFYFFISGLFFKDYGSIFYFAIKKINKLIIPFIFFYVLAWLTFLFFDVIKPGFWSYDGNFFTDILSVPDINCPLWFLECLFWCNIVFYFVQTFCNKKYRIAIIVILAIFGFFLMKRGFFCPTYFYQSFLALPFFYLGSILRHSGIIETDANWKQIITSFLLIGLVVILHWLSNDNIIYIYNYYQGNILLYYAKSVMMIIAVVLICKRIKKLPLISYCGRYSIVILGLHMIYLQIAYHIPNWIGHNPYEEWIKFLFVLLMSVVSIPVFIKLFPFFTAQKDLIKIK